MADHDHSYKQLFNHPELIRDLLEGFVREEWVGNLNIGKRSPAPHLRPF